MHALAVEVRRELLRKKFARIVGEQRANYILRLSLALTEKRIHLGNEGATVLAGLRLIPHEVDSLEPGMIIHQHESIAIAAM